MIKLSEKTEEGPTLWEPSHVTVKCNPFPSAERWCWRLSVWKFVQCHSKNSRMPLNSGQLRSVHVERLQDSGESSKETLFCQNASAKYKSHAVWRKEHYYNIPGSMVSSCPWTWLACMPPCPPPPIKRKEKKNEIHGRIPTQEPLFTGKKLELAKTQPQVILQYKILLLNSKTPRCLWQEDKLLFYIDTYIDSKRSKR